MKTTKLKTIAVSFLLLSSFLLHSQYDFQSFPSYPEVLEEFFSNYSNRHMDVSHSLKFEKRPGGWYVAEYDQDNNTIPVASQVLWNVNTKSYELIAYDVALSLAEQKMELEAFDDIWEHRLYRICPYYGYTEWELDVIYALEGKKKLPDSLVYGLGRAYSSYAQNLIHNNSGLQSNYKSFELPLSKNCMNQSELKEYTNYHNKAIESYKKVKKLNPNFKTLVGDIDLKLSHEYMTAFLDMQIFQNDKEANRWAVDGLYGDFFVAAAKNYLTSCSQNAILFTNGDSDTFPLLYVQAKFGFRTDVTIVNLSLLNTVRYNYHLRDKIFDSGEVQFYLNKEEVLKYLSSYSPLSQSEMAPMYINDALEEMKSLANNAETENGRSIPFPTNRFILETEDQSIEWKIKKHYFLPSQLAVLDIIYSNFGKRPIFFASTIGDDEFLGLDKYLHSSGMAYELRNYGSITANPNTFNIDSEVVFKKLMEEYDWSGLTNLKEESRRRFSANYILQFINLADILIKEDKVEEAKVVLEHSRKLFGSLLDTYNILNSLYVAQYYDLEDFENGNLIAQKVLNNIVNNVDLLKDEEDGSWSEFRIALYNQMINWVEIYSQSNSIDIPQYPKEN